jgi:uncharacterized protein
VGRDLLDELPALSKGQVVIAGGSLHTPVISQTRTRLTRHGGTSLAATDEWEKYFRRRDTRERDHGVVDASHRRSRLFREDD